MSSHPPYLRVEVTLALAVVTEGDRILHDDMADLTMAFGCPIADGPAALALTSEQLQAILGQQAADLAQAIKVFVGQNFAFIENIAEGRGMLDDVRETGATVAVTGRAAIRAADMDQPDGGVQ